MAQTTPAAVVLHQAGQIGDYHFRDGHAPAPSPGGTSIQGSAVVRIH